MNIDMEAEGQHSKLVSDIPESGYCNINGV